VARISALGWVALSSAVSFLLRPAHRRDPATRALWLQHACQRALRALHVTPTTTGESPRGSIIAANHLGYVDVLVLAATTPVVFVAKREIRGWPFLGWFALTAGTRFIDREKRGDVARVAAEFAPVLAGGVSVVLFLESTSTGGADVLPFKSSLLEPAAQNDWPVVPAAMSFAVPAGHSAANEVCWWGDMTLAPHLWNLATLPWIEARLAWGAPTRGKNRKQLALDLHGACRSLLAGDALLWHGHLPRQARDPEPVERVARDSKNTGETPVPRSNRVQARSYI
jgi:lyso-ornithine lipid O-acyltransferase